MQERGMKREKEQNIKRAGGIEFVKNFVEVVCHQWGNLPAHSMAKQLRAGFQWQMGRVHFLAIFRSAG